jgi:hypothetical protein
MATFYNTDFIRRLEDGGFRGGGVVLSCIAEEGAVTVYSGKSLSDGRSLQAKPMYAFAAPIEEGDLIVLASDAAYTYDACEGQPVVKKAVSTGGFQGIAIQDPGKLVANPANSAAADTVAERIAGKYYRTVYVWFPAMAYKAMLANAASPNIAIGNHLIYDVSSEVVIGGGTTSGVTAAHVATADGVYVGTFWALMTAGESQA